MSTNRFLHPSLPRRPARTSQAERPAYQVFSDRALATPGGRRVIAVRRGRWHGLFIEIVATMNGERAGIKIVTQADVGPLRHAVDLAIGGGFAGLKQAGASTLPSGMIMRFAACRPADGSPFVRLTLETPEGIRRGRALTFSGDELVALERAVRALDE